MPRGGRRPGAGRKRKDQAPPPPPPAPVKAVEQQRDTFPSKLHAFKPGQSGNPAGRTTAGATIREWINALAEKSYDEKQLRAIARNRHMPWTKRAAANRILRTLEMPDLADFQEAVDGELDLKAMRRKGLNTEVVKKMKVKTKSYTDDNDRTVTETEREIELFDRAGVDFDRIIDRTEGKARQTVAVESEGNVDVTIEVVGMEAAEVEDGN